MSKCKKSGGRPAISSFSSAEEYPAESWVAIDRQLCEGSWKHWEVRDGRWRLACADLSCPDVIVVEEAEETHLEEDGLPSDENFAHKSSLRGWRPGQ